MNHLPFCIKHSAHVSRLSLLTPQSDPIRMDAYQDSVHRFCLKIDTHHRWDMPAGCSRPLAVSTAELDPVRNIQERSLPCTSRRGVFFRYTRMRQGMAAKLSPAQPNAATPREYRGHGPNDRPDVEGTTGGSRQKCGLPCDDRRRRASRKRQDTTPRCPACKWPCRCHVSVCVCVSRCHHVCSSQDLELCARAHDPCRARSVCANNLH
jgi:hypothetical protein